MTPNDLINHAFDTLIKSPGFIERPDQRQLALLISDCLDNSARGLFEAPTGLGKSLAALIPSIAHAMTSGKRTVIATYTNVLAEQYWRSDLPLALSLFPEDIAIPQCQYLIGRQRYSCLLELAEQSPSAYQQMRDGALLGVESEFRAHVRRPVRELNQLWQATTSPPVCPGRLCPLYDDCYYYKARRGAETARIVITNHNVVLQDALLKQASENELSLLGAYDLLVVDEAHDFFQAALNALEFELSDAKFKTIFGILGKMESALFPLAQASGEASEWKRHCERFRLRLEAAATDLSQLGDQLGRSGILHAFPDEVWKHPQVAQHAIHRTEPAVQLAASVGEATAEFVSKVESNFRAWRTSDPDLAQAAKDSTRNYIIYLSEFGLQNQQMMTAMEGQQDVTVAYASLTDKVMLRRDTIGLERPLRELVWNKVPFVCLSATLAIDGNFEFFKRLVGAEADFEEILPSPFDYSSQATLYLPPEGSIPDPALARKSNTEPAYFRAVAEEIERIIEAIRGRTLVLFHSRREMEAVFEQMTIREEWPILMQRRTGAATVGDTFKLRPEASLFAVRSFWTGFDAPGDTLSCVVIVRIPFEVPIDPPQVARMAWLQSQGFNGFVEHSLPMAKIMIRQGAGRLIRRDADHGVIAILDPRIGSKGYGEEIMANLPRGLRTYRDIEEAALYALGI